MFSSLLSQDRFQQAHHVLPELEFALKTQELRHLYLYPHRPLHLHIQRHKQNDLRFMHSCDALHRTDLFVDRLTLFKLNVPVPYQIAHQN